MRRLSLLLILAACASHRTWDTCEDPPPPDVERALTWNADIRPIVADRCAGCHTEGGSAPFPLDDLADVREHADASLAAVEAGTMPPWLSADCCGAYRFSWDITADERSAFAAWIDQGMPEGAPADPPPPRPPAGGLERVDLEITMDKPYLPPTIDGETDHIRCFLLDWPPDHDLFVTGFALRPGNPAITHHAVVLIAGPDTLDRFLTADREDPGPGWDCPGGLAEGYTGWLGGWSPGFSGVTYPDDLGQPVEAGSRLVLSVHYARRGGETTPDQSTVAVSLAESVRGTLDIAALYDVDWLRGAFRIPAGARDFAISHRRHLPLAPGTRLMSVNLHMHEHGRWGQVGIEHADGTVECLLRIDPWDPGWQNVYWFAEPRIWQRGDRVFVECHYDNPGSTALGWDEDEEMCLGNVIWAVE